VNKNLPRLAKALRGLHCHLTIIGRLSGVQRDSLESEGIQFENLLDLTNAEVRQQYALADIVSFASTIEGFGMPILEAQATGRPVVTSNCSSMPEVAGDAACLVNPFDPQSIRTGISRIIADQGYRQSLVEKGYNNVLRFDRDKIAEQYLQLYKQVASEDS
jgi:glycosyltransferase involved in cell wall biosynthesis